ncbi:MAG: response regulator [Rubrivivax sp.]|nr:response regulator [Rubrivivax sp.]
MRLHLLLLAALLSVTVAWATGGPDIRSIDEAVFDSPQHPATTVSLPDTWMQRGVPLQTAGRYRLGFELAAVPQDPLALMFTHLSTHHRVLVNGLLLSYESHGPKRINPGHPVPVLVVLPPALLRAGPNELEVEVSYATTAGLSPVQLGPMTAMREAYERHLLYRARWPQALNMAAAGLALLLLLIWWRRRSEVALGAFGGLALLTALRNYSYFLVAAIGPVPFGDWLIYGSHVWSVALLGVFAQHFAGVRWPRFSRLLLVMAVVLPLLGAAAVALGESQLLRRWTYPLLIAVSLPALWLCLRRARQLGGPALVAQAAGVAAIIAAGVHDYSIQTMGWLPVSEPYWMPLVLPLALIAVSLGLVRRVVAALGEVEALNLQLERRVAERTRELEAANAAKTRFLAAASHDLRQPMVSVGLLVGLARDKADTPALRQILTKADESIAAMEGLLTGLLDLSRLESGTVQVQRRPVHVNELFASIAAHERPSAERKGLRLRLRPGSAVVDSDPVLLECILRNLVSNAIRYTERGGVLVAARRRGTQVVLEVWDTGVGIAAADRSRVFEEFVQVGNHQRSRSQGLGLGLAIVRRSAALLEHALTLDSRPGQGSRFALRAPSAETATVPGPTRAAVAEDRPLRAWTVLLVEDDEAVRHALAERLRHWGAHALPFASASEVHDWLAASTVAPDAVVSDRRLADEDGLGLLLLLRERFGAGLPCVLITGDTAPEDLRRLQASGLPMLHKPFRAEALLELLLAPGSAA